MTPIGRSAPGTEVRRKTWDRYGLGLVAPIAAMLGLGLPAVAAGDPAADRYADQVQPILEQYCYGCHGMGTKKGDVSLDEFADGAAALKAPELWHRVLKNVRAGIMPPPGKPRPSAEEVAALEAWIKRDAFRADPSDPDPGRVTLRRLNRVEYRNTIRDLMGIDFRTDEEFPADDSGYGFDNIGDVLTISPLLLEKSIQAAETIVARAVPTKAKSVPSQTIRGAEFRGRDGLRGDRMTFYEEARVEQAVKVPHDGTYRLALEIEVDGTFDPEPGKCVLQFLVDGRDLLGKEFGWGDNVKYSYEFTETLKAGEHRLAFVIDPKTPEGTKRTKLDMLVHSVTLEGPQEPEKWDRPRNWDRFFSQDDPGTPEGRRPYAREVLRQFASKAFRRPVDAKSLDRFAAIAESAYKRPGVSVEEGIAQAMVAILASPRFLFRVEGTEPSAEGAASALVDEYSLANRLSYFLWSTMPDEELLRLAGEHKLRQTLRAQVARMLADSKSEALVQNFTGQWLESRDIPNFPIQARPILRQDGFPPKQEQEITALRRLMKQETEMTFSYVLRENRSLLEFLDSDYIFANESLAKHYDVPGVTGREFRRVDLPEESPRGGLITQASLLMITSNPNRTSPVKRGAFLLENFLGSPTPPPPPDIPALEEVRRGIKDKQPTVREVMALHRSNALCASCHSRMDPLGLALENFNALGMWREKERDQSIDASGELLSGQSFKDIRDLKRILRTDLRSDFYRCFTEKLLTYALGRGLDYHDVETVDQLVAGAKKNDGKFGDLLVAIIESPPFQRRRLIQKTPAPASPSASPANRTGARP